MNPTDEAIKDATEIYEVTDKLGRILKIRKPGMLAQYRLVGMLGKAADSQVYLNMVMPLIYLYAIEDDSSIGISTVREMEGVIKRLGEEGVEALMEGVAKHFGDAESSSEVDKEEIKK